MSVTKIAPCEAEGPYWWALLTKEEKVALKERYFPRSWPNWRGNLLDEEKHTVWEKERPHPLQDFEWLALAEKIYGDIHLFNRKETKEIWRQVYRIASEKI